MQKNIINFNSNKLPITIPFDELFNTLVSLIHYKSRNGWGLELQISEIISSNLKLNIEKDQKIQLW